MRRRSVITAVLLAGVAAVLAFFGPGLIVVFRLVWEIQSSAREARRRIESANLQEVRIEADRLLSQHEDSQADHSVDLSTVGNHIRTLEPTLVLVSPGEVRIECQGGFHHVGLLVFAAGPPDVTRSAGCRELIDRVWLYEDTE